MAPELYDCEDVIDLDRSLLWVKSIQGILVQDEKLSH